MSFMRIITLSAALAVALTAMTGCKTSKRSAADASMTNVEKELASREERIESLESSIDEMESKMRSQESTLKSQDSKMARTQRELEEARSSQKNVAFGDGGALPPANVGECFAKVWVPPVYETETVKVLKKEASERIEVIPAKYEWNDEKVLAQEASSKLEVIPATYEWVEEKVLVKPASTDVVEVPASYDYVEEKILDTPAHNVWKKGRGAIEKVDNGTGEIMCLVAVPATYKTVNKRVVKTAATTRNVEIPAEYKTVKKRVVKAPATTREVTIPAEYKTLKVRNLATKEKIQRIPLDAEYEMVTKRTLVSGDKMEWRPILCETNMSANVIMDLQQALNDKGYSPGPIDGVYGSQTRVAMTKYQKDNSLAYGQLTIATLESLNVKM